MNWILFKVLCAGGILAGAGLMLFALWPRRRGRWGINPHRVNCPQCETLMPGFRMPKSLHQALWGGWNCPKCGCEMDKYGNEFKRNTEPEDRRVFSESAPSASSENPSS